MPQHIQRQETLEPTGSSTNQPTPSKNTLRMQDSKHAHAVAQPQAPAVAFEAYTAYPEQEQWLEELFIHKAPFAIPENLRQLIATLAAWLNVIVMPLNVMGLLGIGLLTPLAVIFGGFTGTYKFLVTLGTSGGALVCSLLGAKDLFAKTKTGWKYLFYIQCLMALGMLLQFEFFSALAVLTSFYCTFQIKDQFC